MRRWNKSHYFPAAKHCHLASTHCAYPETNGQAELTIKLYVELLSPSIFSRLYLEFVVSISFSSYLFHVLFDLFILFCRLRFHFNACLAMLSSPRLGVCPSQFYFTGNRLTNRVAQRQNVSLWPAFFRPPCARPVADG